MAALDVVGSPSHPPCAANEGWSPRAAERALAGVGAPRPATAAGSLDVSSRGACLEEERQGVSQAVISVGRERAGSGAPAVPLCGGLPPSSLARPNGSGEMRRGVRVGPLPAAALTPRRAWLRPTQRANAGRGRHQWPPSASHCLVSPPHPLHPTPPTAPTKPNQTKAMFRKSTLLALLALAGAAAAQKTKTFSVCTDSYEGGGDLDGQIYGSVDIYPCAGTTNKPVSVGGSGRGRGRVGDECASLY